MAIEKKKRKAFHKGNTMIIKDLINGESTVKVKADLIMPSKSVKEFMSNFDKVLLKYDLRFGK